MGELARQRSARDLSVSRSHVWAMGAGTLVLAITAFTVGFTLGRDRAPEQVLAERAPDEGELVELLARVEASARPNGGVDSLTFPDALTGVLAPTADLRANAREAAEPTVIEPAPAEPVGDPPRSGTFTIEIGTFDRSDDALSRRDALREAGLDAWIGLELVGGVPAHHLRVGGYANEAAATEAVAGMIEALGSAEPKIVPLP